MSYTERFTEGFALLAHEPADAFAAGTYNSAWVDVENYHRGVLLLSVGTMAATATLNCLIQEAQDAAGTGAANIAGKTITQLTQAGGDGDDAVAIEWRSIEMNQNNDSKFIRVQVTVANAQVELAYMLFGDCSRYKPVPTTNFTEIVD